MQLVPDRYDYQVTRNCNFSGQNGQSCQEISNCNSIFSQFTEILTETHEFLSWNIAGRTLLGLPYYAHTYLLGPIMGQLDLRSQLYIRNFRFLWHGFRSDNNIICTCINNALCNSNSGLGYKLAFYRYRYNITMSDDFELCIARISQCELSDHQLAIVNNLSLLISVREGDHLLLGFTSYEIAEIINELAIM